MQQRFTVVETLPPSKLKGVAHAPSGFGYKYRPIRTDDVLWENKGWKNLLPATNLPARWVKVIGGELVWAIKGEEIDEAQSFYHFQRARDHHFQRHILASDKKARQARAKFRLVEGGAVKKMDEHAILAAIERSYANLWLDGPVFEVSFDVSDHKIEGDKLTGTAVQGIVFSETLDELFEDKDWELILSNFSFEAVWSHEKQEFELTERDYINDKDGGLLLKDANRWESLSHIFSQHDLESYLDNNDMTADDFWAQVHPKFQYLKEEWEKSR